MKRYAILFPGQGSQYLGMGKKLYEEYPEVRKLFDEADEILGRKISEICFSASPDEQNSTENAQPAILLVGLAAYKAFRTRIEYSPTLVAGHSIGEITALTAAGYLDIEDALKLVEKRGVLMGKAGLENEGAMCAVIGRDCKKIEDVCSELTRGQEYVAIANYNSYEQTVISGKKSTVKSAIKILEECGMKCITLKVSGAFHSKLMQSASDEFGHYLKEIKLINSDIPVVANLNAQIYQDLDSIKEYLTQQIISPVQWYKTMELLKKQDIDGVIDMGPGNIVANLAKKADLPAKIYSFDKDMDGVFKYFMDEEYRKENTRPHYDHTVVSKCIAIAVCTKNENDNEEAYDAGVIKPYKRLNEIQVANESEKRSPTSAECEEALMLLKKIFDTKMTSKEEQILRYRQIFNTVRMKEEDKKAWSRILSKDLGDL